MALGDGGLGIMRTEVGEGEGAMVARYLFALYRCYMVSKAIKRSDRCSLWFFWVRRAEEYSLDSVFAMSLISKKLSGYKKACKLVFDV